MLLSARLFHEPFTLRKALAAGVMLLGGVCVTGVLTGRTALSPEGMVTGLLAGFGYALYSIFSRLALNKRYAPNTITAYTFFFTSLCFFFLIDKKHMAACFRAMPAPRILAVLGLSLLVNLIPFMCFTTGLKDIVTGKAAVIISIELVAATLLGIIGYGERLTAVTGLGVFLVMLSLVLINTRALSKNERS
jgi:drug/metabolite transporter (DMT)-like permease